MWNVNEFTELLKKNGLTNITGVPDSTFKEWISYIGSADGVSHTVAVNECEATAIAAGQYLATGVPPVVYMQNDGFGKVINPYTSLCSKDVFSIPMLLLVGWRGEPGKGDASQHLMMGSIMEKMFAVLNIPYAVLSGEINEDSIKMREALEYMRDKSTPYALVLRKGVFDGKYVAPTKEKNDDLLSREAIIDLILNGVEKNAVLVATTGKASRELFELRKQRGDIIRKDFYNIGAMGCAPAIAFGIASCQRHHPVYVIDGDGALLMQMGTLATIGHYGLSNLKHIVIDNNAHDSTGGQPNSSDTVDFAGVAQACGYKLVERATVREDVILGLEKLLKSDGPALLVIDAACGARADLGRPDIPLNDLKDEFMNTLISGNNE